MRAFVIILFLLVSTTSFADNHEFWRYQSNYYEWGRLPDSIREQRHIEEMRMLQGLQRELRDTGKIAPKDQIDIYNLRQGYGYDGGYNYQQQPGYYNYGY